MATTIAGQVVITRAPSGIGDAGDDAVSPVHDDVTEQGDTTVAASALGPADELR